MNLVSARKARQERQAAERREATRRLRVVFEDPRRRAVADEIYDAFEGVSRVGAMSWNDADIADSYGTDYGRFPDTDSQWEQLVADSSWYGGWCFSFLDGPGTCYYLPAAMIRNLMGDDSVDADSALRPFLRHLSGGDWWSLLHGHRLRLDAAPGFEIDGSDSFRDAVFLRCLVNVSVIWEQRCEIEAGDVAKSSI